MKPHMEGLTVSLDVLVGNKVLESPPVVVEEGIGYPPTHGTQETTSLAHQSLLDDIPNQYERHLSIYTDGYKDKDSNCCRSRPHMELA